MGKFPQNNSINVLGELKVREIYSDVRFQESVGWCSGSFGSFCVAGFVLWGRAGLPGPPPVWFWSRSQPESRERNHAEAVSEAGEPQTTRLGSGLPVLPLCGRTRAANG